MKCFQVIKLSTRIKLSNVKVTLEYSKAEIFVIALPITCPKWSRQKHEDELNKLN
jgi:hypothetical protein